MNRPSAFGINFSNLTRFQKTLGVENISKEHGVVLTGRKYFVLVEYVFWSCNDNICPQGQFDVWELTGTLSIKTIWRITRRASAP